MGNIRGELGRCMGSCSSRQTNCVYTDVTSSRSELRSVGRNTTADEVLRSEAAWELDREPAAQGDGRSGTGQTDFEGASTANRCGHGK